MSSGAEDEPRVFSKVLAHGGEVVTAPYVEGDLLVATFRDPPGNVLGVWQRR